MSAWFITGTDTGCGKTAVTEALLRALQTRGSACGYKPVAAGCELTPNGWQNDDALQLQAASSGNPSYQTINPYALPAAIAPHIAAEQSQCSIDPAVIHFGYQSLAEQYDYVCVEGAGGWRVPLDLDRSLWFSDIPPLLNIPVILVVGLRLGCINHATLTAESILASGNRIAGWVANTVVADMPVEAENLNTLKQTLSGDLKLPLIAQFPYQQQMPLAPRPINLPLLLDA